MNIPYLNLQAQYEQCRKEIDSSVLAVVSSGRYILSENVREFEKEFCQYNQSQFAIALASGTDALLLSLRALGIQEGDEVIVPAFTFISTVSTVCYAGATPVFADIDLDNFNMSAQTIEAALTKRTRAIILVHLYGQVAVMEPILKLCRKKGIVLIEDVAQAIGSEYQGTKAGNFGKLGCFSFYPTKNLGCAGDGGLVSSNFISMDKMVRKLRDHGQAQKYQFEILGYNSRLDEVQAAILRIKLRKLEEWNKIRRSLAQRYLQQLKGISGIVGPQELPGCRHVYNLFTIRAEKRDKLKKFLDNEGIGSAIHYPYPLHLQKAFAFLKHKKGDFPNSERASQSVLCLPLYPHMPADHVDYVCAKVRLFYNG